MLTFATLTSTSAVVDLDRFTVRKVRHPDGRLSHWIFSPAGEVHRPSLAVLTRHGTSTQETYAYSLVDHLNWLHVNSRSPDSVTFDDLRRYMNGVTGRPTVCMAWSGAVRTASRWARRRRATSRRW
ncbi:hypothetical protein [Nocardia terpenica]|uniref:hypothetical protein n=1 Tax=Nocardia terpenica TaxID=455432 RepID=UPI000316BDE2|nr:hypothetical protein [Nocardia terpenica]